MKKWLVIGGTVSCLLIAGYAVLSHYAVKFIEPQFQNVMRPGLAVDKVEVKTTCLSLQGIRYEDPQSKQKMLWIEEVRIYPNLFSFLKGNVRIREFLLLRPSLFFYRSREGMFTGPWPPLERKGKGETIPIENGKAKKGFSVEVDRIRIEGGSVDFEDQKYAQKYGRSPLPIKMRELSLRVDDIRYPIVSMPSPFELRGVISGDAKTGQIEAKGWIDLQTADAQSDFKVYGIEVKTLEPYYRKRVSAEIESGYIDLEAKIELRNRVIDAPGSMELVDLKIKQGGTVFWIPAETLAVLLKDRGNRIKAKFRVKGNMDDPRFDLQESVLTRIAFSFGEALGLPVKSVGEMRIGGAGKGSEGLSEGLKLLGDFFKKKENKKQEKSSNP